MCQMLYWHGLNTYTHTYTLYVKNIKNPLKKIRKENNTDSIRSIENETTKKQIPITQYFWQIFGYYGDNIQ